MPNPDPPEGLASRNKSMTPGGQCISGSIIHQLSISSLQIFIHKIKKAYTLEEQHAAKFGSYMDIKGHIPSYLYFELQFYRAKGVLKMGLS